MSDTAGTAQDCSPGLRSRVPWRVTAVQVDADYTLHVTFADGTAGRVRCGGAIWGPRPGVFAALRDARVFGQAFVEHGAVTWPGELDLAPDAMYDAITATGEWLLT